MYNSQFSIFYFFCVPISDLMIVWVNDFIVHCKKSFFQQTNKKKQFAHKIAAIQAPSVQTNHNLNV